jgi:DNA-binding MarR family transcriptional regulator
VPNIPESDLLFLIHDVARLMRTRADQRARAHGMTRAQWVILIRLNMHPGMSQNELASLVEVEPITIARLIDRLEARGLVERRHDPRDRRVRRLHLTSDARPYLALLQSYADDLRRMLSAGIDDDTLEKVTTALLTIKDNLLAEKREGAKAG